MNRDGFKTFAGVLAAVLVSAGLAFAGSRNSVSVFGDMPLFALCVAISMIIQWAAFIPSYITRSEKFYDLTGSLTYVTVIIMSVLLAGRFDIQSLLLAGLVLVWTFRLGFYLFRRILRTGEDTRFKEIKQSAGRFLLAWTIQGLWVGFTAAAALAAITAERPVDFGAFGIAGLCVWVVGFSFEAIADFQKSRFSSDPVNRDRFIRTGLWSVSRHPNYFGEIVIWIGIAIIAFPSLRGWGFLTLVSPIFVALLITKISGVPLLERFADEKWGGLEDYETYKRNTPVLIPKLPGM
jgi:steroid 5-alpha reductase family enzyme